MFKKLLALIFLPVALSAQEDIDIIVEKYMDLSDRLKVYDILVDDENTKWIGTNEGLFKFSSIKSAPEVVNKETFVRGLTQDRMGDVWVGADDRQIYDEGFASRLGLDEGTTITDLCSYRGLIYVATDKGLYTFNPKLDKEGKHLTKSNSRLPDDQVNMLHVDSKEQLWVGTNAGLVKIKKHKIKDVYERKHKFWAATETSEGLWVVSNLEMWLLDFKESEKWERWRPAALNRGLSKGQVRALTSDSKGRLYLASETLVRFDPYTDNTTIIDKDYGFVSSDALALACDSNDDLWVGTADQGLFRIDIREGDVEELSAVAYVHEALKCNGNKNGEVRLKINGGKAPYTILWNTMNGDLNKTQLTGLGAGVYTATIVDSDEKRYVASTNLDEPEPFMVQELENERVSALGARDGRLKVAVTGGTPPYKLRWNNGKRNVEEISNLQYGEYTLNIIDENYCEYEQSFFIGKPKVLPQLDIAKVQIGQTLRIEQLFFRADSAEVSEESFPVLDEIFDFLSANPNVIVEIGGHTNRIPPHEYCDKLSTERARNVAEYLYTRGLTKEQIVYKGYGKRNPIALSRTKQARQKNQRVELKIIDIKRG